MNWSAVSELENGNAGQDGGEKHPLKTPWGVGVGLTWEVERSFSAPASLRWLPWSHRAGAARLKSPLHSETLGPEAKRTVTEGKWKRLPSPFCFPTKRYSGNGEFIPPHPFFFYSLNPGYKLLTCCGRVIHRS